VFSRERYRTDVQLTLLLSGVAVATAVSAIAFRARALSRSGAVAAALTGTLAVAAGWRWGGILVAYFVSSSLLSRYRASEKLARAGGRTEKHGPRDALQVVANGGAFAAMALGDALRPDPSWQTLAAGALAASAADTWATEVGLLARAAPRSILTGRPVPSGTSGGVTLQGFLAAAAGATFVALVAASLRWPLRAAVAAVVGGVLGSLLDSVVGASLQSRRWCASCRAATEQRVHECGAATAHTGGLAWLDNDGVNGIATLGGAFAGAAASALL
jgi:uncharacterized protein (TIGR00297 family)